MTMTGSLHDHLTWIEELRDRVHELEDALRSERARADELAGQVATNEGRLITIAEAVAGIEGELHPERC